MTVTFSDKSMSRAQTTFAILFLLCVSSAATGQAPVGDSIADSHVRANVPVEKDFDSFLKRDLEAYFKDLKKKDVVVDYQLLRDRPTQSGTALPKFYAWVKVKEKDTLLEEGAVRVAAMEKKRFGVLEYLTRVDIERDLERVYQIFPRPVGDKIKERVGK
jgi:hypothetical protein